MSLLSRQILEQLEAAARLTKEELAAEADDPMSDEEFKKWYDSIAWMYGPLGVTIEKDTERNAQVPDDGAAERP